MTKIEQVFRRYEEWYRKVHVKELMEGADEDEEDPPGALDALRPVPAGQLAALSRKHAVPAGYRTLLAKIGAGPLLCAADGGSDEYALLRPSQLERARRDCVSWLGADAIAQARKDQGLDVKQLVPFLVMPDGTTWVLFAGTAPLDRVFYVSHDWEQREEDDLFAGPLTLVAFFEHFFARARKRDGLNGSYTHRYGFGKRP
jgi:hypothetical protein